MKICSSSHFLRTIISQPAKFRLGRLWQGSSCNPLCPVAQLCSCKYLTPGGSISWEPHHVNVIKVVWIRTVIYSFSTTRKHLALAWWQIFLNQLIEISDDICSLCLPGGMRYGRIQVHCEEVITSPDTWIKRQLCLPEQPSAPFTQRVFVRLSWGEKALLCSYSIKLEAWKPQEDGGWRLSICLT